MLLCFPRQPPVERTSTELPLISLTAQRHSPAQPRSLLALWLPWHVGTPFQLVLLPSSLAVSLREIWSTSAQRYEVLGCGHLGKCVCVLGRRYGTSRAPDQQIFQKFGQKVAENQTNASASILLPTELPPPKEILADSY